MTRHSAKDKAKKPTPKRLTITASARHLGVTREHLSRVLHGHRQSRSLLGRYHSLLSDAA